MAKPNKDVNSSLESEKEKPWWNRPVLGKGGLIEDIINSKKEVPEEALIERKKHINDLYIFAKTAEAIDSPQFLDGEFITYIKIQYMLDNDLGEYANLKQSYRYLELAIDVKDLLLFINQTELRYRGYKQQEFYDQVPEILKESEDAETFKQRLEYTVIEAIAQTKTPEGKEALNHYVDNLKQISDNLLGLNLLRRFHSFGQSDYSVLVSISDLIRNIEIRNIHDLPILIHLVNKNITIFDKISQIIQIPPEKNNSRSFALIVQFIALNHQHRNTALKFEELIKVLRQWLKYYSLIASIQQAYPETDYKQPPEFTELIPGEKIYRKYLNALTDKSQQIYYYDLGQNSPL
ncbi:MULTISPECIES: hypothetical protein [unclassified Synechocystis]|uniref:hypothetical protein n=1 Tax=unclassified Synechocystis TaxID=2640012 RepID=UPI00049071C9|nr:MULTISPECIES: hypothetical protein [unclassified Synechocystis]AIE75782.1 hypothetical protein D082_32540 [Synechocystis sp. PCC 6714]MCT0255282.1 hypothetical protein [Synechocystis sp. CS-94]